MINLWLFCRQPLHHLVYQSEGNDFTFFAVFREVLKVMIAGPSSNSLIGMENDDELYGFSALVLSEDHSFSAEFVCGTDDKTDFKHVRVFMLNKCVL